MERKKYTPDELQQILDMYAWDREDEDEVESKCFALEVAKLRDEAAKQDGFACSSADHLCGADLREANLCGVDLRAVNLSAADLRDADLFRANLEAADLTGANLCGVDLREVNLRDAKLRDADLSNADLRRADLSGADLTGANLYGAKLPPTIQYDHAQEQWIHVPEAADVAPALQADVPVISIPEPPSSLPQQTREALVKILTGRHMQRGDRRRHLRVLCLFVKAGSLYGAGNGDASAPIRDLRVLERELGIKLKCRYEDKNNIPRTNPTEAAVSIAGWLGQYPELLTSPADKGSSN